MLFAVPLHLIAEIDASSPEDARTRALLLLPECARGVRVGPVITSPVPHGEAPPPETPAGPLPRVNQRRGETYHLRPRAR